jgi:hypothetical protein
MKYHHTESASPMNFDQGIFQDAPSYNNQQILCKLSAIEAMLQNQYADHIQAEHCHETWLDN